MATIEREHERERIPHELPVFVASDGRRARRLRLAASAIAVLALLWLAALAAGMFGFGRLPGISTPLGRIGGADKPRTDTSESKAPTSVQQRRADLIVADRSDAASGTQRPARARTAVERRDARAAARRPRTPRAPGTAQPVQPQPAPPPPQQGWARHGRPAPPGYTRRTTPTQPQPPPPPPGQATAPGQAKKALQPPPPPPPPPAGNGGGAKKT
jgi:hypothetical protein